MKKSTILLSVVALGIAIFAYVENRAYHRAVVVLQKEHIKVNKILKKMLEVPSKGHTYLKPGIAAPDFSFPNADGEYVQQNSTDAEHTLLVFSNKGCHYCDEFYPVLDSFAKAYPEVPVVVLKGYSDQEYNRKFLDSTGFDFTVLDATQAIFDAYKIDGTPTCVYLDAAHKIVSTFGAENVDEIKYATELN
jgi:thiol-disulfide isomerase/thioredoxin